MCTTGKPSTSPKEASATGRPARDPAAALDDPANLSTQDTFRSSRHHRTTAPPTSETSPSVAPARGWWHRRAGDRSCSGGAQLGTPGTCWCSVAPKDLSDRGALAEDLAPDSRGYIGATLGPQTIRSERTTPDTNGSASFPLDTTYRTPYRTPARPRFRLTGGRRSPRGSARTRRGRAR
jgi:hypothetical protein